LAYTVESRLEGMGHAFCSIPNLGGGSGGMFMQGKHDRQDAETGILYGFVSRAVPVLFPACPRMFRGQRWLNIGLRSAHIVGVAGISGGFLFGLEEMRWMSFWYITLATGVVLSLLYVWSSAAWLFQLKGLVIVIKLLLLGVAVALPAWRAGLFMLIILISGLIAHAPGRVRGYGLVSGNRKE